MCINNINFVYSVHALSQLTVSVTTYVYKYCGDYLKHIRSIIIVVIMIDVIYYGN